MPRTSFLATFFLLLTSTLNADTNYFSWSSTGATTGIGSAQELTATYNLLPNVTRRTYFSDVPGFVDDYGRAMPGFEIDNNSSLSGTFTFSAPLPAGSIMTVLDIDLGETITFSANTTLALVEHRERLISGNSVFPSWDNDTQSISAASGARSDSAATIIDVSGLTQLSFFFTNEGNTGTTISFGVVGEPSGQVTTFLWTPESQVSGRGEVSGIQARYDLPPIAEIRNYEVDNQDVVQNYTGDLQGFQIGVGIDIGSGSFSFSRPLPRGSVIFFQDLDFEESVTMTTNVPVEFIENIERFDGSTSDVVSYDSSTQTVSAFSGSRSDGGLTFLDAEGLTSLTYTLDMPNNSSAGIGFAVAAVPVLLGDVNLDSAVDFSDIPAFIAVLQSGEYQAEADCDENGLVSFADIPAFIAILSSQ